MKTNIVLRDRSVMTVEGIKYREHFCIYWDNRFDYWVISHNNTKMAVIPGIMTAALAMEIVDGMMRILDDWDFHDVSEVCCVKAYEIKEYLKLVSEVMYQADD